jgi:alpha-beta hydrolase superfamily lysophospholipase
MMKNELISTTLLLCAVAAFGSADDNVTLQSQIKDVQKTLAPLVLDSVPVYSEAQKAYFRYYGLHIDGAEHFFGTFKSQGKVIAAHVFKPSESKGTVLVVHGYYDHAGIMSKLIKGIVGYGYTVAVYDQPGHGLSSGERASIEDFSEYSIVFMDFVKICKEGLDGPHHVVAHSMGCTAIVDYLLVTKGGDLDKVLFLAPLIRSAHWGLSGLGQGLSEGLIEYVPRKFRKNSSDKEFLAFMKKDPLQAKRVPINWVGALRTWNDRAEKYGLSEKAVNVLQGTRDTTVDASHNMKFLKKKFSRAKITYIEGAGHQLMNESPKFRTKVFQQISTFLAE